ncbi:MAG: hypothetical protein U1E86_28760 [Burkholderiaceae bacterium]
MNGFFPTISALAMLVGMLIVMAKLDGVPDADRAARLSAARDRDPRHERTHHARRDARARERESELYSAAERSMSAIKVIQAFTREEEEHRRFIKREPREPFRESAALHLPRPATRCWSTSSARSGRRR